MCTFLFKYLGKDHIKTLQYYFCVFFLQIYTSVEVHFNLLIKSKKISGEKCICVPLSSKNTQKAVIPEQNIKKKKKGKILITH